MARARRTKELTTTEKIGELVDRLAAKEEEIESAEQKLIELKNDKKAIETELQSEKLNLLLETMEAKNISLDRAKEIIDNVKE